MKTTKGTDLPIIKLKGKDYLQVAYRLVWFREDHPDWRIETEFVNIGEKHALAKASIRDQNGAVMATAHKREDASHFADYSEKAETGAIGRALALCGYGTQFCADDLDEGSRIVDAPLNKFAAKNNQPDLEDGSAEAQALRPYVFPAGSFKNKTPIEVFNSQGREVLERACFLTEENIKKGKPYSGMTMDDMHRMVSEIANVLIQFENGGMENEQTNE